MCNGDEHFCPMEYKILFNNSDLLLKLKKSYMFYYKNIKKEYSEKSFLKSEQVYYRNIGLIMGVFLFAAGCIISIVASIWSGYLMVLIGLLLFNYAKAKALTVLALEVSVAGIFTSERTASPAFAN